jgi:cell envelope opacity-associated protein A
MVEMEEKYDVVVLNEGRRKERSKIETGVDVVNGLKENGRLNVRQTDQDQNTVTFGRQPDFPAPNTLSEP